MNTKPVILIILDGWGIAPPGPGNAINLAQTPNFNQYWAAYPRTQLKASGKAVGLPKGENGNSEAGHLNLGAGLVVYQDLPRINFSIADGSFLQNKALIEACQHAKENNSQLHLMGLIGGEVHASREHLYALLWLSRQQELKKEQIKLHLFTDGRDAPPRSALTVLSEVDQKIKSIGRGEIASISGRYYAMDRDRRWDRLEKAYKVIANGDGPKYQSPYDVIEESYKKGTTDEFIDPAVLVDEGGKPKGVIKSNDAVIFFNYRADRGRQLTKAFVSPSFEPFERPDRAENLFFMTMTEYEEGLPVSAVAFPPQKVEFPIGRVLAEKNKRQLRTAETEKYPHVTFFFNGEREDPFPGEDRILIPSPKVATYDKKPEMSAGQITEVVKKKINHYDFILINFANPDMVGHTGVLKAGIKAVETVDNCLGQVVKKALAIDGVCLVTADHGNAEEMLNPQTGEVDTEHSTNPVPFIAIGNPDNVGERRELMSGVLADIAPTVLALMGISKPGQMTGRDLLS